MRWYPPLPQKGQILNVGDRVRIIKDDIFGKRGQLGILTTVTNHSCRVRIDGDSVEFRPYWHDELKIEKHLDTLAILKKVIK